VAAGATDLVFLGLLQALVGQPSLRVVWLEALRLEELQQEEEEEEVQREDLL
jgi:hypothetical protein